MRGWRRFWLAILCVAATNGFATKALQAANEDEYYELMKVFVDTFEQIDRNYVTQVDRRDLMEAAMRGMLLKLDPYSSYIDNKELRSFNEHVEQEFGGIGIQVTFDASTRQLKVMTPLPGTPAYKAGVRPGDRILEIDDKPTAEFKEGSEMESAVNLMRGKPNTIVKVKIQHLTSESPESLEITRATIKTPTVQGDHFDAKGEWSYFLDEKEKIGYIRLTSFGRNSSEEMRDVLTMLQKEGMRALVLDLRFNPGGLLTAATEIADDFISSGVIVSTKGRNTEENVVRAHKAGTFSGFPMIVLVNRYSASASEIVSACLQDHKRAIIVGERTWGKGSVQNVIELEGGKSALKLTTATYHRPSGKNIHRFPKATEQDEWGVMPDEGFNIRMSEKEIDSLYRSRIEKEVIRGDSAAPKSDFVDKQLDAGLEAVRKMLAEGKTIVEQPVEKVGDANKKSDTPDEKNPDLKSQGGTSNQLKKRKVNEKNDDGAKPEEKTPDKKPEEKKDEQSSFNGLRRSRSLVEAILEFWQLQPRWKPNAA